MNSFLRRTSSLKSLEKAKNNLYAIINGISRYYKENIGKYSIQFNNVDYFCEGQGSNDLFSIKMLRIIILFDNVHEDAS
jgi:hypothetical protein